MDRNLNNGVAIEEESAQAPQQNEGELLESFGYKQEMSKSISTISNFAIAFGCCSILSGLTPMWGDAMMSGGSVAVIWGWVLVSIFTMGVGLSLAEICSAYPLTGGLYIWTSQLAPKKWVPLACFVTGYCNWLGLTVAITSTDLSLAQFLGSVINMQNPDYTISKYWEFGIFLVIAFIHGVINSVSVRYNGFFNQTSLYWHLIGTLLLVIVALVLTPNKPSAEWVRQIVETSFSLPMTQVFMDGVGNKWTIVFCVIIMGAMFFSGSALTLGSSRMVYAFARDGATPFSPYLSKVNDYTKTPVWAVWANVTFAAIVGILYIINDTAYGAIVSVNTIASSAAYFIPIYLRLTVSRNKFKRGPFHLGPFSHVIGWCSCFWILFTFILFVCPSEYPVTPDNMNYASVIFCFVIFASVGYYFVYARKWFKGPSKSMEPDAFMDEGFAAHKQQELFDKYQVDQVEHST
ncbi:hypothetical protein [Absidia glauca]|uniref:Amino acid permease/ SLC12A domain-containing protein n=1 Tax=Absidia glauca TaxID=4829 RepID=A0A163K9V6_ABSGL|nr:hypothetical protein [Absidia glauca]